MARHPALPRVFTIGRPTSPGGPDAVLRSLGAFTQAISKRPAAFTAGAPDFSNRAEANAKGGNRAAENAKKGNRAAANAEKGNRAEANAVPRTKDEQAKKRTPLSI